MDYQPSSHAGKGKNEQLTPAQTRKVRSQASQHQTTAKKRKVVADGLTGSTKTCVDCICETCGEPLVRTLYLVQRPKLGKRGKTIPSDLQKKVTQAWDGPNNNTQDYEQMVRTMVPKFNVAPGYEVGNKFSPSPTMDPRKAFKKAHKNCLPGNAAQDISK